MISFFATLRAIEAAAPYCYGIIALVGVTLVVLLTMNTPLAHFRKNSNLQDVPLVLFAFAATIYAAVTAFLLFGLLIVIWRVIFLPSTGGNDAEREFLFSVLRIAGLTTVLGAVIALPITISRLRLTREQTLTAGRSLFNEKINAALEDLYSRRQFTLHAEDGSPKGDIWHDDITRRNAAIDRLERLALEDKSFAPDIARMLAIYVRELSKENPPEEPPDTKEPEKLRVWASRLKPKRTDMENAVQTLGRLMGNERLLEKGIDLRDLNLDLRNTNLQGFDLNGLCFERTVLDGAQLQGARLFEARLQWASLVSSQLQGAELTKAQFFKANFRWAQLQGAELGHSNLQRANLEGAHLQGANIDAAHLQQANLKQARLRGADLGNARLKWANLESARLQETFLSNTELQEANLRGASLEKAVLPKAQLQGAILTGAQLQGAYLEGARLQGANLRSAQLQGADFIGAQLQGTVLRRAELDDATSLTRANLRGAAVREVDFTHVPQIADHLDDLFGDATVILPDGVARPELFNIEYENEDAYSDAWRAFRRELSQDPDNPA